MIFNSGKAGGIAFRPPITDANRHRQWIKAGGRIFRVTKTGGKRYQRGTNGTLHLRRGAACVTSLSTRDLHEDKYARMDARTHETTFEAWTE
jgi:hypothetical protein